eukprot:1519245-Alexandrium_andersonii.AAC.1
MLLLTRSLSRARSRTPGADPIRAMSASSYEYCSLLTCQANASGLTAEGHMSRSSLLRAPPWGGCRPPVTSSRFSSRGLRCTRAVPERTKRRHGRERGGDFLAGLLESPRGLCPAGPPSACVAD